MNIKGKVAVVAGGTSGLGLATCELLAAQGAHVAIFGRRKGQEIADRLDNAVAYQVDIADSVSARSAVDAVLDRFGAIHINVNTAGLYQVDSVVDGTLEHVTSSFEKIVATNLTGTFNVLVPIVRAMASNDLDGEERGVVINTSSYAADQGVSGYAAYSASKAGLIGMMLPIARDVIGLGIRVNTIVAGGFDTPMIGDVSDEDKASALPSILNPQRIGRPDEFAALVRHLIENSYMNAASVSIDAGHRLNVQTKV